MNSNVYFHLEVFKEQEVHYEVTLLGNFIYLFESF